MDDRSIAVLPGTIERFVAWLDDFGPASRDHQSYYAGPFGRWAKALYYRKRAIGTLAVAPMILSEAFLPQGRRLFASPMRFPIADAHYAMGFAFLAKATGDNRYHTRAVEFLESLIATRCRGYAHYCWGYPFDWVTRTGIMTQETPLITTTPYVFEAFSAVYEIDGDERWLDVMRSIAEHAFRDIPDREISLDCAAAGYNPHDVNGVVINASAYRAFLLTAASLRFEKPEYRIAADKNLNFVLQSQQPDGSWHYATDGARDFVDHFHTCFVLKALAKIERLTKSGECTRAIERGVEYYVASLFDGSGVPKPFARAPRLTVYRHELYDYAECLNVCTLLGERFPALESRFESTLRDLLQHWVKPDGSFRSRRLLLGWDNVPMHRWAQSQVFRSLAQVRFEIVSTGKPFLGHCTEVC